MAQGKAQRTPLREIALLAIAVLFIVGMVVKLGVPGLATPILADLGRNLDAGVEVDLSATAADVGTWSGWPALATTGIITGALVLAGVLIVRRVRRIRDGERERLITPLRNVMPDGWDHEHHLRIRRWRRFAAPRVVLIWLTPRCEDSNPEWRTALTRILAERMGGRIEPIRWPKAGQRRRLFRPELRRIVVRAGGGGTADSPAGTVDADEQANAKIVDTLSAALSGLVPKADPTVEVLPDGRPVYVVAYGETTRDLSPAWRARVLEHSRARLGVPLRSEWDRKSRLVRLHVVPKLPKVIYWLEEWDKFQAELQVPDEERRRIFPYFTDEDDRKGAWEAGNRAPHALVTGITGGGKTQLMQAIAACALLLGWLVAVVDPKKEWAGLLGKPGVLAVANEPKDRVGLTSDLLGEVRRRNAADALRKLQHQAGITTAAAPPMARFDDIPILLIFDEMAMNATDIQAWWSRLPKDVKEEEYGTSQKAAPMLNDPARLSFLARSADIHGLHGLQRGDAPFFGDSTAMRDMLGHRAQAGKADPIGSEQQWGDRWTGSTVEIEHEGEGLSNGSRFDNGNRIEGAFAPGRAKFWYPKGVFESDEFWKRVEDAQQHWHHPAGAAAEFPLPSVSAESRDPAAAIEQLMRIAYGGGHMQPLGGAPTTDDAEPESDPNSTGRSESGDLPPQEPATTKGGLDLELAIKAADLAITAGKITPTDLRRKMNLSRPEAIALFNELARLEILGAPGRNKSRQVLVPVEDLAKTLDRIRAEGHTAPAAAVVAQQKDKLAGFVFAAGAGGWKARHVTGSPSDAELELLRAGVVTRLDSGSDLPQFPTPEQVELRPRRLVYGPVDSSTPDGPTAWWHSVQAGTDDAGRPGNVVTQVVMDRAPHHRDLPRPITVWRADWWSTPYGSNSAEVAPTYCSAVDPGAAITHDTVRTFTASADRRFLTVLTDAVVQAMSGGRQVVLAVEDSDAAAHWIAAVTFRLPPAQANRCYWSTLERVADLIAARQRGLHLVCIPMADLDAVPLDVVLLAERETPELGDAGGHHRTARGDLVPALTPVESAAETAGPEGATRSEGANSASDDIADLLGRIGPDHKVAVDDRGAVWSSVAATEIRVGDLIQTDTFGEAKVLDVPGFQTDEFGEVFRIVIDSGRGEETVDLNPEESVFRRD